jgi:hypothetical protein
VPAAAQIAIIAGHMAGIGLIATAIGGMILAGVMVVTADEWQISRW